MRQSEMESLVSGIKQLNGVLVVVMPDCLLYSAWQRPGQAWDAEVVGAFLGELARDHEDGLDAIDGWSRVKQMTVEIEEALVVLCRSEDSFVIGFVFERGTAIGWARLQVQRTLKAIERVLEEDPDEAAVSAPAVPAPPPLPPRSAEKAQVAQPAPVVPSGAAPAAEPPMPPPLRPSAGPAERAAKPDLAPFQEPIVQPTGTGPNYGSVAPAPEAVGEEGPEEASPVNSEEEMPKGTRLIKYLDAHAPDTHAALLRVSLQTGLPLTLLRMPDSLSDDEFAQVEESVRRILGVEQLNF